MPSSNGRSSSRRTEEPSPTHAVANVAATSHGSQVSAGSTSAPAVRGSNREPDTHSQALASSSPPRNSSARTSNPRSPRARSNSPAPRNRRPQSRWAGRSLNELGVPPFPPNDGAKVDPSDDVSRTSMRWSKAETRWLWERRYGDVLVPYDVISRHLRRTALACRLHFHQSKKIRPPMRVRTSRTRSFGNRQSPATSESPPDSREQYSLPSRTAHPSGLHDQRPLPPMQLLEADLSYQYPGYHPAAYAGNASYVPSTRYYSAPRQYYGPVSLDQTPTHRSNGPQPTYQFPPLSAAPQYGSRRDSTSINHRSHYQSGPSPVEADSPVNDRASINRILNH